MVAGALVVGILFALLLVMLRRRFVANHAAQFNEAQKQNVGEEMASWKATQTNG